MTEQPPPAPGDQPEPTAAWGGGPPAAPAGPPSYELLGSGSGSGSGDVLPAQAPEGRGGRRTAVVAAAVAGTLAVGGAGVAAALFLSGGGAQPEDVLPKGALAFAKLDLDPAAEQKLNIYALSRKFPDTGKDLKSADSLRDDVLRKAFEDAEGIDYDRDVKPWIGDRAGVAVLPSDEVEPDFVLAVAYTDRDAAEKGLAKAKKAAEAESEDPLEYVLVDDYALLSDDAAAVRRAADADEHLSDDADFTRAVDALGGDQVAVAWADLGRFWDAVPVESRGEVTGIPGYDGLDPKGQVVVGVHAERSAVEVVGRTLGVTTGIAAQDAGLRTGEGTGLAGLLPDEAFAALSVSGFGESLKATFADIEESLAPVLPDLEAQAQELGFDLPDDLVTVLGDETAVGVWGEEDSPEVLVRTRTDQADEAREVLARAFEASGGAEAGEDLADYLRDVEGGLVAGTPGAVTAATSGRLGDREEFRRAVPDAKDAGMLLWVSLQDAFRAGGVEDPDLEPLEAVGLTVGADEGAGTGDAGFRLRLTFR